MTLATYGDLKTAIATRSLRTDLTAMIPDFVRLAHDVIIATVSLSTDIALVAGTATVSLPTDFRTAIAVVLDDYPANPLTLSTSRQMTSQGAGQPSRYRVSGTTMTVGPTPQDAMTGRVQYKLARAFFASDAADNSILLRYPMVYLHGALSELFNHARNSEERDRYLQLFTTGMEAANAAEREDLYGSATLQMSPSIVA